MAKPPTERACHHAAPRHCRWVCSKICRSRRRRSCSESDDCADLTVSLDSVAWMASLEASELEVSGPVAGSSGSGIGSIGGPDGPGPATHTGSLACFNAIQTTMQTRRSNPRPDRQVWSPELDRLNFFFTQYNDNGQIKLSAVE